MLILCLGPLPACRYTLKIAVGFLQVATTVCSSSQIPFPSAFKTFISYFNLVNLDFISCTPVCLSRFVC